MPADLLHPVRDRVPAKLRTALAWGAFALSPVVLLGWAVLGHSPDVLPLLAMALTAGVLRRRPWAVVGLLLFELVLMEVIPLPDFRSTLRFVQVAGIDVVVGYLAATRRPAASIGAAALALVVQLAVIAGFPLWPDYVETVSLQAGIAMTLVWLIGLTLRLRQQNIEARRSHTATEAIQAERLRIARELHDMVAHSMGVIAIQAGVGSRVIDTQPAEARNALHAIEAAGRDTLAGLRRMLGALRESGEPAAAPLGLDDLDALIARSADAGVHVDLQWRGERRPLPPDIDLAAFRIIQEAVTNVTRHAGTDRCEVLVDQRDDELLIEVTDDGRGGPEGAGYGIPGMRERVALLHGDFTAGPRPDGGFRVSARIPVPVGVR
ncbi:sensor histidine kinase [Amycolatopsis sp. NPDC051045]|uniref:sensor histidine kinase n=1 Tax=Amycolatopsis sp. NPDC051045 TaxID=3156922 RepID=UPI003412A0A8